MNNKSKSIKKSILFIVGCLEPMRNGVGDYTLKLAKLCAGMGVDCMIVSINDSYIDGKTFHKYSLGESLHVYRTNVLSCSKELATVQNIINDFQPNWISLQFVPYSYDKRGFVLGLNKLLKGIKNDSSFHLMFHEIWIGINKYPYLKDWLVGKIQKFFIRKLIKILNPKVIHTSNEIYRKLLSNVSRISISSLPIFSNIPLAENSNNDFVFDALREKGVKINKESRRDFWIFGIFGTLYKDWPVDTIFDYIHFSAEMNSKKVIILSFGNQGSSESKWKKLSGLYCSNMSFVSLGMLADDRVAEVVSSLDYGLATSSYGLAYKSGSVMTFLDQGIPVLFTQYDDDTIGMMDSHPNHGLMHKVTDQLPLLLPRLGRMKSVDMSKKVVVKFLGDLNLINVYDENKIKEEV